MALSDMLSGDLEFALQDAAGVLVEYGSTECWGHLTDLDGEAFSDAPVTITAYELVIQAGKLSSVEMETQIVVDGTTYMIRGRRGEGDGRVLRLLLTDV